MSAVASWGDSSPAPREKECRGWGRRWIGHGSRQGVITRCWWLEVSSFGFRVSGKSQGELAVTAVRDEDPTQAAKGRPLERGTRRALAQGFVLPTPNDNLKSHPIRR